MKQLIETESITHGKTFRGDSFEFRKGGFMIYQDDGTPFPVTEIPVLDIKFEPDDAA